MHLLLLQGGVHCEDMKHSGNTGATKENLLRPRQVQMNSLVKHGQNSLQVGAYLLGNRVVLLNIRHHLLCHWPLLCSAPESGQFVMAFCISEGNGDTAFPGHVGKRSLLRWPYSAMQSNSSNGSSDKQVQGGPPQCE